jgi:nickel-type superoxide dismutase maturation protease
VGWQRRLRDWLPIRRFVVADTSMRPTLQPGDRLIVARWLRVSPGDLVVVHDPRAPSTFLVKRVRALAHGQGVEVRGDNPNVSSDSREFGLVPSSLIVGRACWRYSPPERRGFL